MKNQNCEMCHACESSTLGCLHFSELDGGLHQSTNASHQFLARPESPFPSWPCSSKMNSLIKSISFSWTKPTRYFCGKSDLQSRPQMLQRWSTCASSHPILLRPCWCLWLGVQKATAKRNNEGRVEEKSVC